MSAIEVQYNNGMKPRAGQATAVIDAPPDDLFTAVTAGHTEGAEWTIERTVLGRRFTSRAHVIELDRAERRFVYRSRLEGENPSFAIWDWQVEAATTDGPSRVTLAWELRPVTFLRKRAVSPLRNRWIARCEAPGRLAQLRRLSSSSAAGAG